MKIDENDFLSFLTVKQGLGSETIRHCMSRFRIIKTWFADKELTKENVEKFFLELKQNGLRNNSLNTYHFAFKHLQDYCRDRGMPSNFFVGFRSFKKNRADIVILTPEEIEKILNTSLTYGNFRGKDTSFLDFRYTTMEKFLAFTGARYSEASKLKIRRLDLNAGQARFIDTKTNENRSVYFTEPLISDLREITQDWEQDDNVFRNSVEKPIHVSDFSADLKRRARAAGIAKRIHPHIFRHSYITHMLEAGVPITEVASLVGHKDIRTTYSTYMHLADQTLRRASLKHPLVRKNVDPLEIIRSVKEVLENLHLNDDPRFEFEIKESEDSLNFSLLAKSK